MKELSKTNHKTPRRAARAGRKYIACYYQASRDGIDCDYSATYYTKTGEAPDFWIGYALAEKHNCELFGFYEVMKIV